MYNWSYWKDRVTQYIGRFIHHDNADGSVTHTPVPGTVMEDGTEQDADHFNNIETGIQALYVAQQLQIVDGHQKDWRIDDLEAEAYGELGTVTLTNSAKFPFNNSRISRSLSMQRDTTNYSVEYDVTACTGNVGEIFISDKLVNGFKIEFTGSASSVTVKYKVLGGFEV